MSNGNSEKFVLRSRRVWSTVLPVLAAVGIGTESLDRYETLIVIALAGLMAGWSLLRPDGALLKALPKLGS